MSTMILPAVMYMIFALCFITFALLLRVDLASDMYKASMERFERLPWELNPTKAVYDVQGGPEVFDWLKDVFMNQLFAELPQRGGVGSYCSEEYPCTLGEGVAREGKGRDCAEYLVVGDRNCPTYMPVGAACCEPCTGADCPVLNVTTKNFILSNTTSVVDVSQNCADEMPSWLEDLSQWVSEDAGDWGTPNPTPLVTPEFQFCPERVPKTDSNINTRESPHGRPLMVAQYNQALLGRMSMKRHSFRKSSSESFANAYPFVMGTPRLNAGGWNLGLENKTTFGDGSEPFQYKEDKGYRNAGAFISYLNFVDGTDMHSAVNHITYLQRNNWFDLNQGSFVLEMLLFNGNIEKFLYVAFVFEHGFAGQTSVNILVNSLELSLHDPAHANTYVRFGLYLVILVLFVYFLKNEFDDMSADYASYFTNFMAVLHLGSLCLSAACIIRYLTVTLNYTYINFKFPLPQKEEEIKDTFENLCMLGLRMEEFMTLISININLIFIRLISLLTGLAPDSGIVFNTIYQVRFHLFGFFVMFLLLVLAFAFSGYYLFGAGMWAYSQIGFAFTTTMKAILRESLYQDMQEADPDLGFAFYLCFHLFFLIAQQPLLSILIRGYHKEMERMRKLSEADRYPLKRFWKQIKATLRESSTGLNRVFVFFNGLLFGSGDGGSMRINYEQVARLRDGRATRPRIRNVVYDKRSEDYGVENQNLPVNDVVLTHQDPFYPNGMMQYYVKHVKNEGAAQENGVKKGFRLIGIEMRGSKDREDFRCKERFHRDPNEKDKDGMGEGYGKDTKAILQKLSQNLPVTLEFEGGVKPVSRECICLIVFIIIFMVWSVSIIRGDMSNSLTTAHKSMITEPVWYAYNPSRLQDFKSLDTIGNVVNWIDNSVLRGQYNCLEPIGDLEGCQQYLTSERREDYFLWSGPGSMVGEPKRSSGLPLNSIPPAADGLSVGYLPLTDPAAQGVANVETTDALRMKDYNLGVMQNNHVRLTFQVACFQKNENERYSEQYPMVIHKVIQQTWGCASEPCMKLMLDSDEECYSSEGILLDLSMAIGQWSNIEYKFTEIGTYGEHGGYAIGLGKTFKEAETVRTILGNDRILSMGIVSLSLESVTYNANLDLFTYTAVMFNVHATGLLDKQVFTSVFPLTIFSQGQYGEGWRRNSYLSTLYGLFGVYAVFVLYFLMYLFMDLAVQYQITKELQKPPYMFPIDFFLDDWWNFIDVFSTICNLFVVSCLLRFMLVDYEISEFSSEVVASWTMNHEITLEQNLQKADQMSRFYDAAYLYNQFLGWVALNGLFMFVRLIKYFGAVLQLRLMMTTLSAAFYELSIITSIIFIKWVAFAVMFYMRFGIQFSTKYGDISRAFTELFLYVCGRFDTRDMQGNSPVYFITIFTAFQVIFFMLVNMYLAAIVYRWKDARRDAQEFSLQSTTSRILDALQPAQRQKEEKKKDMKKLDAEFWQRCSVISHLNFIDKYGKIRAMDSKGLVRASPRAAEAGDLSAGEMHGTTAAAHDDVDDEGRLDLDKPTGAKEFLAIFKRVHMEIASQLCRKVKPRGAGVGDLGDGDELPSSSVVAYGRGEADGAALRLDDGQEEEEAAHIDIGIVEEAVDPQTANMIEKTLAKQLEEQEHVAEEIWLDSLVTVLESAGTLEKLQKLFLPPPMIMPKKPQDRAQFWQKRSKMEERLNGFLKWLQEEMNIRHYRFLKDSAAAKERVLKQQSLVLTDYLEHLDEQIAKLQDDIKVLERKTAEMRAHVQPLM